MLELHKTQDLFLKQPEDWNRDRTQQAELLEQNHSRLIFRMILYLFNR